jgi:hypothetical protein
MIVNKQLLKQHWETFIIEHPWPFDGYPIQAFFDVRHVPHSTTEPIIVISLGGYMYRDPFHMAYFQEWLDSLIQYIRTIFPNHIYHVDGYNRMYSYRWSYTIYIERK